MKKYSIFFILLFIFLPLFTKAQTINSCQISGLNFDLTSTNIYLFDDTAYLDCVELQSTPKPQLFLSFDRSKLFLYSKSFAFNTIFLYNVDTLTNYTITPTIGTAGQHASTSVSLYPDGQYYLNFTNTYNNLTLTSYLVYIKDDLFYLEFPPDETADIITSRDDGTLTFGVGLIIFLLAIMVFGMIFTSNKKR